MDHHPGSVTSNSELWLRCIFCGDSRYHLQKTHLSINLRTGLYHCYRCQAGGKLKPSQLFTLLMKVGIQHLFGEVEENNWSNYQPEIPPLKEGAAWTRPSVLERFHYRDRERQLWDAFEIRDPIDEQVCGVYLRSTREKKSRICGGGGFGWVGETLPLSNPQQPLRIVEGPYDVLDSQTICTFGLVTAGLKDLRGQFIVLTPDGDVWQEADLFKQFLRKVYQLIRRSPRGPYLLGIEVIPDGLDPDECPPTKREYLSRETIDRSYLATRAARRAKLIQEVIEDAN